MRELSGKQRRYLRGLGNQLEPVIYVGKEGISEALLRSIEEAYSGRELIKVRLERSCPVERREAGSLLASSTRSLCSPNRNSIRFLSLEG